IFINSPHNPTGKVLSPEKIKSIVNVAQENGLFIISDEAYEDVIFDGRKHTSPASLYENTVSLYSMSKSYAMSGLRLGYVHSSNEKLIERMKKMLRCTINGVNSITQYGAIVALNGPQDYIDVMRSEYQRRRDIIYGGVRNSKYLEPLYPEGAFYLWAKIREFPEGVKDSWDFSKYLLEKTSVGSTPGPVFGPENDDYIRFAFSAKTEDIREAAELIKNLI
ncbi:MAG: pyridoxal phosphate-dependent aminotransferase, partial [Thermoplasmata archaeon]